MLIILTILLISAQVWLQNFRQKLYTRILEAPIQTQTLQAPAKVRVAIIDTGIDVMDTMIESMIENGRLKTMRNWAGGGHGCPDMHGHGTHVTRLVLDLAPCAEIYVAKVSDDMMIDGSRMSNIAMVSTRRHGLRGQRLGNPFSSQAIQWTVTSCDVDIISVCLELNRTGNSADSEVNDAVREATRAGKLILAAAPANEHRISPFRRYRDVIYIHACDSKGNRWSRNPVFQTYDRSFSTLGVGIQSSWKGQKVYNTGTSFAAAIATAIAANILDLADRLKLPTEDRGLISTYSGMTKIFDKMSMKRDGYDYIRPANLWEGSVEEIAQEMFHAIGFMQLNSSS